MHPVIAFATGIVGYQTGMGRVSSGYYTENWNFLFL